MKKVNELMKNIDASHAEAKMIIDELGKFDQEEIKKIKRSKKWNSLNLKK